MQVRRTKTFEKSFMVRIKKDGTLRTKFEERLGLFLVGVRDNPINDHALSGNMKGKRSFSITGDVRVVYEKTEDEIVFLDVGTHNQVYK